MTKCIFLVICDDEIIFASFFESTSRMYADRFNSDCTNTCDAVVHSIEVPIAMLRRIPELESMFSNYSESELYPFYEVENNKQLMYDGELIDVTGKRAVKYVNDEYIYMSDEDMWYLADNDELVLPNYEIEQEVEAFVDVEWKDTLLNNLGVFVVDEHEYTRSDVFMACYDFLPLTQEVI